MSAEQNNATPVVNMDMSTLENHPLSQALNTMVESVRSTLNPEDATEKYKEDGFEAGHMFVGFTCQQLPPDTLTQVKMGAQVFVDIVGSQDLLTNALLSHMDADPHFARIITEAARQHTIMGMLRRGGHSAELAKALTKDDRMTQIANVNPTNHL